MDEVTIVAVMPTKIVRVAGSIRTSWLLENAINAPSSPSREVEMKAEIQDDGHGYLLIYTSNDPSIWGDTWHESQEEAEKKAFDDFRIEARDWVRQ
jgi:hypothetical protein